MPTPVDFIIDSINASKKSNCEKNKCTSVSVKYPCGICQNEVKNNDKSVKCSKCSFWIHIRCNGISVDEYKAMIERNNIHPELIEDEEWNCMNCTLSERANIFPFGFESNYNLNCINSSNSMKLLEMVPEFEIASNISIINSSQDIDANVVENINCKYYTNDEFCNLTQNIDVLNIMHCNVDGCETHFDNFHQFLIESNQDFDIICISETSLQKDEYFSDNTKLYNYCDPYITETLTAKGGVAIFAKDNMDTSERHTHR